MLTTILIMLIVTAGAWIWFYKKVLNLYNIYFNEGGKDE